jgi:hypothetical protein
LSGDVAILTFVLSFSSEPESRDDVARAVVEQKMLVYLQEVSPRLQRDIEQATQSQLGPEFRVSRMDMHKGSIEILVILGTVGTAYILASRYKNFVDSINLLVSQVRGTIERFMRNAGPGPGNFTIQHSWAPGPALANPRRMPVAAEGWDMSKILLGYLILSHAILLGVFIWMLVAH